MFLKLRILIFSQLLIAACKNNQSNFEKTEILYNSNHKVLLEETEEHVFRYTPQFITFIDNNLAVLTRTKDEIRLFDAFSGKLLSALKASDLPYNLILKEHKEKFNLDYDIEEFLNKPRSNESLKFIYLSKLENGQLYAVVSFFYPRYGKYEHEGNEVRALFYEVMYALVEFDSDLKYKYFFLIDEVVNNHFASISSFSDWKKIDNKIFAPTTLYDSIDKEQYYIVEFKLDSSLKYFKNDSLNKNNIIKSSIGLSKRDSKYLIADISWAENDNTVSFGNQILKYSKNGKLTPLIDLQSNIKLGKHFKNESLLVYQEDGAALLDKNSYYKFFKIDLTKSIFEPVELYDFGKRYNYSRPILNQYGICFVRKEKNQSCYVEFYSY